MVLLTTCQRQLSHCHKLFGLSGAVFEINFDKDLKLNVDMTEGVTIEEVVISAEKKKKENATLRAPQMGTVSLPVENIKKLLPFWRIDILKSIQLLPGVLSGEGNAGFYVRGGGPDQNLVLLDRQWFTTQAICSWFFSVFNADAIKNTTLIKEVCPPTTVADCRVY